MKDLAPGIVRQRMIIEGLPSFVISDAHITEYLTRLSVELDMKALIAPATHRSEKFGWAGWIHWETSGTHFYAWEKPHLFFSVDIYTCKSFDEKKALEFTRQYFQTKKVAYKSA